MDTENLPKDKLWWSLKVVREEGTFSVPDQEAWRACRSWVEDGVELDLAFGVDVGLAFSGICPGGVAKTPRALEEGREVPGDIGGGTCVVL